VKFWVAITDLEWYEFLSGRQPLDEVNFWQPSATRPISLPAGSPWLFKLHARDGGWIVGGGFVVHYTSITPRFAWEAFGEANGAASLAQVADRMARYRRQPVDVDRTEIGSNILVQPFFLSRDRWIPAPADWPPNVVRGKTYDSEFGVGRDLWEILQAACGGR
jgi:putative restriction endonuclease